MKAGFIGLGTMGASMAANLQKGIQKDGHTVLVHDVRRDQAASHLRNGAVWADSPAAMADACDIIFSSLPGPVEFEAVSYGENGLLSAIRPGTAYFDLTTNAPTIVRKAHDAYAAKGAFLFDAPVSGGPGPPAESWRSGAAAMPRSFRSGSRCSTPLATKHSTSARSARDLSPSWCITATATSPLPRPPRSSAWASRRASSRWRSGKPSVRAPLAGVVPSNH